MGAQCDLGKTKQIKSRDDDDHEYVVMMIFAVFHDGLVLFSFIN